jgi:hypothetical protein
MLFCFALSCVVLSYNMVILLIDPAARTICVFHCMIDPRVLDIGAGDQVIPP